MRLGGWHRIGILVWALWGMLVIAYAAYELITGTESRMLLIHMVETGEPGRYVQQGYSRVHLVPVQASLVIWRVVVALLALPAMFFATVTALALAARWVRDGFKEGGA